MDYQHTSDCPHCRGEVPPGLIRIPAAPATRVMRRGPWQDPETGIIIGTDEWRRVRCIFCDTELMTPVEVIPRLTPRYRDGTYAGQCGPCIHDLLSGQRPGTTQRRASN